MSSTAPRLCGIALLMLLPLASSALRSDPPEEAPDTTIRSKHDFGHREGALSGGRARLRVSASPFSRGEHALIMCGHPGDAAALPSRSPRRSVNFAKGWTQNSRNSRGSRQYILFGNEKPKDMPGASGPATKEAVAAAVAEVRKNLRSEDGLWVICLGHGQHDGKQAYWCLPGPDLGAAEFGKLFVDVNCREQVFVLTYSLSGYFRGASLARRDRVVIAATGSRRGDQRRRVSRRCSRQALAAGLDPIDHDIDKDGKLTLFDLYVVTAKEITAAELRHQ